MCYKRSSSFLGLIKGRTIFVAVAKREKSRKLGEFPPFYTPLPRLNEEAGYKRMVNWPIFRDSLALGNGDNY